MTLSELNAKFFARPTIVPPTTIHVFTDEDSADAWVECKYLGRDDNDYELTFTLQSHMSDKYYLKDIWCKAEVQQFYAVEPDVIVVVVKPPSPDK